MDKKINPWLKLGLELGPILLFFIGFGRVKDKTFSILGTDYSGFIVMTAGFVALMIVTSALLWRLTGKLSRTQGITLALVVVMGGLSVWLNDERFIKMKPTLLYAIFAGTLAVGLMRGQSWLRLVMDEALPLQTAGWMILTRRLAWFFAGLAVTNEAVWRLMSTEAWVTFKTFGLTGAVFVFFLTQGRLLETYATKDDAA